MTHNVYMKFKLIGRMRSDYRHIRLSVLGGVLRTTESEISVYVSNFACVKETFYHNMLKKNANFFL